MKFNGEKIRAMATKEIVLPRPNGEGIPLLIRSLGRGEEREAFRLFPDPEAPKGFAKDERGNPLRDPDTGKVVTEYLFSDPKFVRESTRAEEMRFVYKFVAAIGSDERITFEATGEGAEYYEAVAKEIEEAGITEGDMALAIKEGIILGNMDAGAIERAAEAFSEREQARAEAQAQ